MKLLLKSLNVKNFKGLKQFRLMFDSTETKVYGANATGKTSLADAFFFVFSGKDSQERQAKDWIQCLDAENNKVHRLEHEAEVMLELDGDLITIARKVQEKWTKPKGQQEEVLAETLDYTYYIDGVPTPAKQFDTFLKEKFMADIIHLLSNPMSFCNMDWKKQREMLYTVCGQASDEDVISTDARFTFLTDALKHKDVETLKAALRKTILTLKDDIKSLDAVIKDRKSSLIKESNREDVLKEQVEKEARIAEITKQLEASNEVFEKIKEKQRSIVEIERAKEATRNAYESEKFKDQREATGKLSIYKNDLIVLNSKLNNAQETIARCQSEITILDRQIEETRNEWKIKHGHTLNEEDRVCPCCGQDMPMHKIDEINSKFEADKVLELERIVNKANSIKSAKATEETKIRANQKLIAEITDDIDKTQSAVKFCDEVLSKTVSQELFDCSSFDDEISVLQREIDEFNKVDTTEIKQQLDDAHKQLQYVMVKLHKCDEYDKAVNEIKSKEQEKLQKQTDLAEVETQLINATDFVTTKVKMLEDKVNSKFKAVKFKLFKLNQKGNYEETCTALVDGVDWVIANTAAKVQAGIEIINSLQAHFDFYAPIWVDNRESVVELPSTPTQLVNLIVSESDAELRVD